MNIGAPKLTIESFDGHASFDFDKEGWIDRLIRWALLGLLDKDINRTNPGQELHTQGGRSSWYPNGSSMDTGGN